MKKTLSLALVVLMVVACFAVFTVNASAEYTAIEIWDKGMENWENSPFKGEDATATQILFCPEPWDASKFATVQANGEEAATKVTVTMDDGTTSATFTLPVATMYNAGAWGILRVEPCLGKGENQWIPVKDVKYTATFKFTDKDGVTCEMTATDEGVTAEYVLDKEPVVPSVVVPPVEAATQIKIGPKFGGFENWVNSPNNPNGVGEQPGVTQMLVGVTDAEGKTIDISGELTWVLTIDGTDYKMAPATIALAYDLYRFEVCMAENAFVPEKDATYTVSIKVYDGETLKYESDEAQFTCPMDPVDPPVTGDNTAIIAVLAIVALFGTAVVVTKKVSAR